jgi:hypothetical protein
LQFVDRFQGLVPVDHAFVMLTGDDILADMAIGRLAVTNTTSAEIVVNKIISYENILLNSSPVFSETQFLFVADNDDEGGSFCAENQSTAAHLPLQYGRDHICQGTPEYPDVASVKAEMLTQIAQGLLILNYRGHGSIEYWAGGSNSILRTSDVLSWQNTNKPTFVLSADCLDGYFVYPGIPSISETYLRYDNNNTRVGIAGMWSSTGIGYTYEHTVLHKGFYDGLFVANGDTVGEAILYAKLQYEASGYHESEQYTFTLQGDPAMIMPWGASDNFIYLPFVSKDG